MKTPITRRIFFWTLFVSYFITTGIVLFFVFGYRHDIENKIFIYTGSLTLKTNPKSVNIKLNGEEPKSRLVNVINDSYFITGLRPGQYDVEVDLSGFKPWLKSINIHSGLSTELWNVLLLRNEYEEEVFDIENIDDFFPAPEENIFAITSQMGKTLITYAFDTKKNQSTSSFIFPKTSFTDNVYENIEWSPNSEQLIIPIIIQKDGKQKKDYVIASTKTSETKKLSDFVEIGGVKFVRWDPEEEDVLYFLVNNNVHRLDLNQETETSRDALILENVVAYDFADDGIYALGINGELLYGGDKKKASKLEELTAFDIDGDNKDYRLIAYDNHRVVAIDDINRDLYLYNKGKKDVYTKKLGSNIIGVHFSDDGKKLLFYSPFEIFVYITRDSEAQPLRYEDQTQSIIRFSERLDNVHFSKNYEHVIYTVGSDIKITELDYRGSRITDTITSINETETIVVNKHKMNKLFFVDTAINNVRQLRSIEFPEKETLF